MRTTFRLALCLIIVSLLTVGLRLNGGAQPAPRAKRAAKVVAATPLAAAGQIILLPIDDRPAVGQFAQMIGRVADHQVVMPPRELLGRFTQPGDTAKLRAWLEAQDYRKANALVVSLDMLVYGGLVASRVHGVTAELAQPRLEFLRWFKKKYPRVPLYVFSTIMRVAPTATAQTRTTHDGLARWAELMDRVPKAAQTASEVEKLTTELTTLQQKLDPAVISDYLAARERNLQINLAALALVKQGVINELVLLQDDAREFGLHRQEQAKLKARLQELKLTERVPIYNGADEGSLSLVSRAILDKYKTKIRVAVVYSSEKSKTIIAPYEDHPLQFTVESQIRAAGGVVVKDNEPADYRLYVNAPATERAEFNQFVGKMVAELKAQRPVALADVLFPAPHYSGADERLIEALKRERLFDQFVGYAAWNTAGNTLGTTIPQANMRVLYRKQLNDTTERNARAQTAQLEFLLHRYVGDYLYHDIVRPVVNQQLRAAAKDGTVTYELTPELYAQANTNVAQSLRTEMDKFFAEQFKGRQYLLTAPKGKTRSLTVDALNDVKIYLPWARTFEVVVDYRLNAVLN